MIGGCHCGRPLQALAPPVLLLQAMARYNLPPRPREMEASLLFCSPSTLPLLSLQIRNDCVIRRPGVVVVVMVGDRS